MVSFSYSIFVGFVLGISLILMKVDISSLQGFFLGMVVMLLVSGYPDYLRHTNKSVKKCK